MIDCLVCQNAELNAISTELTGLVTSDCQRFVSGVVQFLCCDHCGYIRVEHTADVNAVDFYGRDYQFVGGDDDLEYLRFDSQMTTGVADYLTNLLKGYVRDSMDFHFLDIGAGKGTLVQAVQQQYPSVRISAVEPSPAFKTLEKRAFLQQKHHGFFSAKVFAGQIFDLISLIDVLEHVPDPSEFLREVKALMWPGSCLFIEVPNFENNPFDVVTLDHLSKFTPASLQNLLTQAGFEVVEKRTPQTVAMQFMTRVPEAPGSGKVAPQAATQLVQTSLVYCDRLFEQAAMLKGKPIALYGQAIIAPYLVGSRLLKEGQVQAMIDDNPQYHGQRWLNQAEIVGLETFRERFSGVPILVTMNQCYHDRIMPKLSGLEVCGLFPCGV